MSIYDIDKQELEGVKLRGKTLTSATIFYILLYISYFLSYYYYDSLLHHYYAITILSNLFIFLWITVLSSFSTLSSIILLIFYEFLISFILKITITSCQAFVLSSLLYSETHSFVWFFFDFLLSSINLFIFLPMSFCVSLCYICQSFYYFSSFGV